MTHPNRLAASARVLPLCLATLIGCSSSSPAGPPEEAAGGTGGDVSSSGAGGGTGGSVGTDNDAAATGGSQGMMTGLDGSSTLDGARALDTGSAPIPSTDEYLKSLYQLSDLLLSTQITTATDPAYGALVSASTNPDKNPIHSRGAEAVYPFAVAFKHSQNAKYADAAVLLGNWLTSIQSSGGGWIEEWPSTGGWDGTTADQLISMAGAYTILKARLTTQESARWVDSITKAADFVQATFPRNNVNYTPTGAVALVMAHKAVPSPKASWLTKAASLMDTTLQSINTDNFITGEGSGVDLGYNIAQSIGYIAMYGLILPSTTHVDRAASLLKTHEYFMYPNGAIDNSWGTRTYKWTLESGTKTAPGVYFSFALIGRQGSDVPAGRPARALIFARSVGEREGLGRLWASRVEAPDQRSPEQLFDVRPRTEHRHRDRVRPQCGRDRSHLGGGQELVQVFPDRLDRRSTNRQDHGHALGVRTDRHVRARNVGARRKRERPVVRRLRTDRLPAGVVADRLHARGSAAHADRTGVVAAHATNRDDIRHVLHQRPRRQGHAIDERVSGRHRRSRQPVRSRASPAPRREPPSRGRTSSAKTPTPRRSPSLRARTCASSSRSSTTPGTSTRSREPTPLESPPRAVASGRSKSSPAPALTSSSLAKTERSTGVRSRASMATRSRSS